MPMSRIRFRSCRVLPRVSLLLTLLGACTNGPDNGMGYSCNMVATSTRSAPWLLVGLAALLVYRCRRA